jgi:hypothetical protein
MASAGSRRVRDRRGRADLRLLEFELELQRSGWATFACDAISAFTNLRTGSLLFDLSLLAECHRVIAGRNLVPFRRITKPESDVEVFQTYASASKQGSGATYGERPLAALRRCKVRSASLASEPPFEQAHSSGSLCCCPLTDVNRGRT